MKIFDTLFSKKCKPTYFKFSEKDYEIIYNIVTQNFINVDNIYVSLNGDNFAFSFNLKNYVYITFRFCKGNLKRFSISYKDKEMFNGVFSNKCDLITLELSNKLINHIFTTEKDLMIYFEKILNNVNEEFILPYFKMKEDTINEHLNVFDEFTKMLNK